MSTAGGTDLQPLLEASVHGPWWDLLQQLDLSLAVSREYEHFILLMSGDGGKPWVSAMELPHPSGMFLDPATGELIVSSTRTPNQIFWLRQLTDADFDSEVIPGDFKRVEGTIFLPYRSVILPGTLYIHDVVLMPGGLHATITGHNFLARIDPQGGWKRVWWPKCVDGLGRSSFDQNYLQLNSIAISDNYQGCHFTAFSDETSGAKPWKAGYGPRGRGVVFDGKTRDVLVRELTCPHSAKHRDEKLWLCNSGYGELCFVDLGTAPARHHEICRLNGFTRGLAFHGDYAFVGLSKVIDFYEPYAPGLDPKSTACGVVAVNLRDGSEVARLEWPNGYQIYDVQALPGVKRPVLPTKPADAEFNTLLRYLG